MPNGRDPINDVGPVKAAFFSLIYSLFRQVVARGSEERASRLGAWISPYLYNPLKKKRLENYRKFFGTTDPERDARIEQAYLAFMGQMLIEGIRDEKTDLATMRSRTELQGTEHIEQALKLGKGVMLLNGHMGNFYASHQVLSLGGYKVTNVSARVPFASMERQINRLRQRFNVNSVFVNENAARAAIKTFRRNGIFSIFFEVVVRWDNAVALPFGHAFLDFDPGPALLAIRHGVPVLPVSVDSSLPYHHRICVQPPFPVPLTGTDQEKALQLLDLWRDWLQDEITKKPALWWAWSTVRLHNNQ